MATKQRIHPNVIQIMSDVLRALVDDPDKLSITTRQSFTGETVIEVATEPNDMGKLIGVNGRSARALRIILSAMGTASGTRYSLDVKAVGSSAS